MLLFVPFLLAIAGPGCTASSDMTWTGPSSFASDGGAGLPDGGENAPVDGPYLARPIPIRSGDSVFFVGNSFLGGDDSRLAEFVASMGAAMDPPVGITVGQHVVYGNQKLSWFFQQHESQDAIASGRYQVFVLQAEEREPVDRPDGFRQAVRDYHAAVTAHGGRLLLFMTWDFVWEQGTTFFQTLSTAYEEIGAELGIPVIPVGLIYDDENRDPFGNEAPYWLTDQALHQNAAGAAVNVYATFGMLTGINPNGTPVKKPDYDLALSTELYRYLSDKAWARVEPRLAR